MPFTFDPTTGRYRNDAGWFVPEARIRRALDTVIDVQTALMQSLTQQLIDGRLSLASWQVAMMAEVKTVHLLGASVAMGGWHSLDQSDFGWIGQRVRSQYAYLRGFAADLASGRQKLDGQALARTTLYAEAGRQTHRAAEQRAAQQRGLLEEMNRLGGADHCPGCLSQTSRGWVPIGSLVPCGSRECLTRCHCSLQFRARAA